MYFGLRTRSFGWFRFLVIIATMVAALGFVGPDGTVTTSASAANAAAVSFIGVRIIQDATLYTGFEPPALIVAAGTPIQWQNTTPTTQILASRTLGSPTKPGPFGPQILSSTYTYTFTQPGAYLITAYPAKLSGIVVVETPPTLPSYRIVDLGPGGNVDEFSRIAIHDLGQVVATSVPITLPNGSIGYGVDINDNSTILGTYSGTTNSNQTGAFLLARDDTLTQISGQQLPSVYSLNDSDQVVGMGVDGDVATSVVWQNGTVIFPQSCRSNGVCSTDWLSNTSYGINNAGQIGGRNWATGHPMLWRNGTVTDLGAFGCGGGSAYGVNRLGWAVGSDYELPPPGTCSDDLAPLDAFLWRDGVMYSVDSLDCAPTALGAINDRGQALGTCGLWEGGRWFGLTSLIPANSGWSNLGGGDINDRGEIVGFGTYQGATHAFERIPQSEP